MKPRVEWGGGGRGKRGIFLGRYPLREANDCNMETKGKKRTGAQDIFKFTMPKERESYFRLVVKRKAYQEEWDRTNVLEKG